jgi:hypothetical protein
MPQSSDEKVKLGHYPPSWVISNEAGRVKSLSKMVYSISGNKQRHMDTSVYGPMSVRKGSRTGLL